MTQRIQKAAVLGAGTMGARIAAHFANAGLPCLLLDITPKDATPAERNKIVAAGLEAAKKAKPAAFFTPGLAAKVSIGNFEDDLARIADADWIIEVVAENLEIKRGLLAKVAQFRKSGAHGYNEYFRIASSPHRRGIAGGISAALGGDTLFQSAALYEIGGSDSRAEDFEGGAGRAVGFLRPAAGERRGDREGHAELHREPHRHVFDAERAAADVRAGYDD